MDNREFLINVGSLSSYFSLYNSVVPSINYIMQHKDLDLDIYWDLRYLERKKIRLSSLTSFLSIAHKVRQHFKFPFKVLLYWDPYILSLLHDLKFFEIANIFDIFNWENQIGGYKRDIFNPYSQLFFFDNVVSINQFSSKEELDLWKELERESIELSLSRQLYWILRDHNSRSHPNFIQNIISTTAELAVNSLLHGNSICFIGLQRTSKSVTVCVCDSGFGIVRGLKNYKEWANQINLDDVINANITNDIDGLLNASLLKKNEVGIKSAIDTIVFSLNGYVTMSSGISELRWGLINWLRALDSYDYNNYKYRMQTAENILGPEKKGFLDKNEYKNGFYENHLNHIPGMHISFEVPHSISM